MNHGVLEAEGRVKSSVSIERRAALQRVELLLLFPSRARSCRSFSSLREVHWSDLEGGGVKAKGQDSTGVT